MAAIETVAILGCGLIGGSFALALKRRRPKIRVVCLDKPERLDSIREMRISDFIAPIDELSEYLPDAEVIVLACPVEDIVALLARIAPHLRPGAIVTDVGSVKTQIARAASSLLPSVVSFIGGHPIAGSQHSGVENADPLLFNERVFLLCPSPDTPPESLLKMIGLAEDLLAVPVTIEPEEHDRLMAMVSHAPQLLSIALMLAAISADRAHGMLEQVAGPGFLDITRIAASDYRVWRGILAMNRQAVGEALDGLETNLAAIRRALETDELEPLWRQASERRQRMTPESAPRQRRPELRRSIDQTDERIVKLLGERLRAVRKIGREKMRRDNPVFDSERERLLLAKRLEWAEACDVPRELVQALFALLMDHSKRLQSQIKEPRNLP